MRRNALSSVEAIRYSRSIGNIVSPQNTISPGSSYRGIGYGAEASIVRENGRNTFGVITERNNPFKIFDEWQRQGWGGSETITPRPALQLPPPTTATLPPGRVTAAQIDAAMN
jgi:hypothetical protein